MFKSAIATLLIATGLGAQIDVIKNGDFESSTSSIAPWVIGGAPVNPTVELHTMSMLTRQSNVYKVGANPTSSSWIEQDVDVMQGQHYSILAWFEKTVTPKKIRISIDGTSLITFSNTSSTRLDTWWIAGRSGRVPVRIEYLSDTLATITRVDHIRMIASPTRVAPIVSNLRLFAPGESFRLDVDGSPSISFAVFLSDRLIANPVPIHGFSGYLQINPAFLLSVGQGVLDLRGQGSLQLRIPIGFRPTVLWMQAVQWNSLLGVADLGSGTRLEILN